MGRLDVRLLGTFAVTVGAGAPARFESVSDRALLARLAASQGEPLPRRLLAELLWPDRPEGQALANLRHSLAVLRRCLGDHDTPAPAIVATRDAIALAATDDVGVDLTEFRALAGTLASEPGAVAAWEDAVALRSGPFLFGFEPAAGEEWEHWVGSTRTAVDTAAADAYRRLVDLRERLGERDLALRSTRRWLEVDPWDERAHRMLVRLLALDDQGAAAIEHAEAHVASLRSEFGIEPDRDLLELVDDVRAGRLSAQPARGPDLPQRLDDRRPVRCVARAQELARLGRRLDAALRGAGGAVFVRGVAGAGKSVLLAAFADESRARLPELCVLRGAGNAYTGVGDPLLPFRQVLGQLCGDLERPWMDGTLTVREAEQLWAGVPAVVEAVLDDGPYLLGTLIDATALLRRFDRGHRDHPMRPRLAAAVDEAARRVDDPMRRRRPVLDQCARVLSRAAMHRPMLVELDDLHWADPGSIELLHHLLTGPGGSPMLVVGALRPAEPTTAPDPLEALLREVRLHSDEECVVDLAGSREFVDAWLDTEPNLLDESFREQLFGVTHGHALMTVETVAALKQRGDIVADERSRWIAAGALGPIELPPRAEAAVAVRLSGLPPEMRRDLEVASVQGDTFAAQLVATVRSASDADVALRFGALAASADALIEAVGHERIGDRRIDSFRFRHGLIRRFLYDHLTAPDRVALHEATGRALAELHAGDLDAVALDLAFHFDEAGMVDEAIEHRLRAGRSAMRLSATSEAIEHLQRASTLLRGLDPSPDRDRRELAVLVPLGACLQARAGYNAPETHDVYERLRELIPIVGPGIETAQALGALIAVDGMRARFADALAGCERLLAMVAELGIGPLLALAHTMTGWVLFMLNRLAEALEHLDRALELYDDDRDGWLTYAAGLHVASTALSWRACVAWCLGRPDQARQDAEAAVASARRADYPFGLAFALGVAGSVVSQLLLEGDDAVAHADEEQVIAEREDFAFYRAAAHVHRGAGRILLGDRDGGLVEMASGLATWEELGTDAFVAWIMCTRAEQLAAGGRLAEAAATIDEIERRVASGDERMAALWYPLALAALRRAEHDDTAAETALRAGLDLHDECGAHGPQLRTATALAELLCDHGRDDEAAAVLTTVLGAFPDQEDGLDVRRAREALAAASRPRT